MPPFDREGALKKAEKALRQGRIDAAIQEYVRLIEAQPRDWNSANALGDLYVRAGQPERGVAEYTRIADHLAGEGFYSKAAALFKKILKIKSDNDYALMQSGELAIKQGLIGDAKKAFQVVAERRRTTGDKKGAAEMSIRIGTLDPDDLDARRSAARAAYDIGDTQTALREYREIGIKSDKLGERAASLAAFQSAFDIDSSDIAVRTRLLKGYLEANDFSRARAVARGPAELKQIASALETQGRTDDMLEVLAEIAAADPTDLDVRAGLAQAYAAKGDLERAKSFLTPETAAKNPALWLTLAEMELSRDRLAEGRAAVVQAIGLDSSQREAAVVLGCRLSLNSPEAGYQCIDAVTDAALAENDYAAAAAALHEFVTRVRNHIVALMRLVEVCVDGGLEAPMYEAQAQLADSYLEVGRGLEARIISEDLVAREPWNRANIERFRKALVMLGEKDPDAVIADRLSGDSPFLATDNLDLNDGLNLDELALPSAGQTTQSARGDVPRGASRQSLTAARGAADPAEVDLSNELDGDDDEASRSLDAVFQELREGVDRVPGEERAGEQYRAALTFREMGLVDEAIRSLEAAARSPRQRFDAASLLGRLHLEQGRPPRAIEWFERNYFAGAVPLVKDAISNNYVRGAISGLGLVNIYAALAELSDVLRSRASEEPAAEPHGR
ncbi:MAG: tetratricopeptide repeat protein [Acidobacteria bacterium]|nr:tetratricopeptide repeat protein [Acidobacteriota bacterium]